ncbi:MAG TPA: SRPBCC family protein [Mycobacteriales bacterium]|nr:SRPBCC family protein [Mycobacteriales bacterium]
MRLAHRAVTSASPEQVWSLLGDPSRWSTFNPFLRRVRGAPDRVRTGQTLLAVARLTSVRVPVDVVEAVPERRLELQFHTAPGVRERVVFELAPRLPRGTVLRVGVVVEGLFARVAVAPLWAANGLVARLLAARAERVARAGRRGAA